VAAVIVGVSIGYAALQYTSGSPDEAPDQENAKAASRADAGEPASTLVSAPVETPPQPDAAAPAVSAPTPTPVDTPVIPALTADPVPPPASRRAATTPPVKIVREIPPAEEREAPPVEVRETPRAEVREPAPPVPEASLVFETRAFVGTRKPKEQSAQLVLGDGKITIIPTSDPSTTLCAIPYARVISIHVSKNRDPLWNSPQGPAPVARAGGALSKFGISMTRDWITLRTSSDEQFVAMRFDDVIMKRVLLALEERTGHNPEVVVVPTNDEKKK
jgi:hypothetical protein